MNKKLILGLATAMVLVSGAFAGVRAECASCNPRSSTLSDSHRDFDRPDASCKGAYYGPLAREPMGSPGF